MYVTRAHTHAQTREGHLQQGIIQVRDAPLSIGCHLLDKTLACHALRIHAAKSHTAPGTQRPAFTAATSCNSSSGGGSSGVNIVGTWQAWRRRRPQGRALVRYQ